MNDLPKEELRPARRRRPSSLGGVIYLFVGFATVTGLAVVALDRWRAGVITIGSAMVVGAFARLLLPANQSGMLGVRSRLVDAAFMATLGGAILFLGFTLYNPSFPFQSGSR